MSDSGFMSLLTPLNSVDSIRVQSGQKIVLRISNVDDEEYITVVKSVSEIEKMFINDLGKLANFFKNEFSKGTEGFELLKKTNHGAVSVFFYPPIDDQLKEVKPGVYKTEIQMSTVLKEDESDERETFSEMKISYKLYNLSPAEVKELNKSIPKMNTQFGFTLLSSKARKM